MYIDIRGRQHKMTSQGSSSSQSEPTYALRDSRISKEDLSMVVAVLMEDFPVEREEIEPYKRVGAVLVLPNDMIYAVDCSRNGAHGVARLIMAHQDILQDCKVFVSRKPCSLCTKLLVQSKVKRVFFLPIEPEYKDVKNSGDETTRIDNLFKVSEISQTVFVPKIGKEVLVNTEKKYQTQEKIKNGIRKELLDRFWKEEWMENAKDNLPWPAFDDNMKMQVRKDFESIMEWIASILAEAKKQNGFKAVKALPESEKLAFNPEVTDLDGQQAERLITVAHFLAERTDDPNTGVGAVIINKKKEIIGLGWNGFPTKALYGEFPRASDKDGSVQEKKYPYIIHAEQNALLMRNTKNIVDGTLFVTKIPCNECTPFLEMQEIKTVVLSVKMQQSETEKSLNYGKFFDNVMNGVFSCFEVEN